MKVAKLRLWHNYDVFNSSKYYAETIDRWSKMTELQFDSQKPLFSDPMLLYVDFIEDDTDYFKFG